MQVARDKYKDLLVIVAGFSIIGLVLIKGYDKPLGWYFIYGALGVGVIGVFSETFTTYITKGWQAFGMFLGKVNSTILLGLLFALMLVPIALLKRIFSGRDGTGDGSSWVEADSTTVDFEKMW